MNKHFSDYQTSKMLKELGFNSQCLKYYTISAIKEIGTKTEQELQIIHSANCYNSEMKDNDDCSAPIWQQIKQWLWDNHSIRIAVVHEWGSFGATVYGKYNTNSPKKFICATKIIDSPIEVEIEGIKEAVEYLYNQNKK